MKDGAREKVSTVSCQGQNPTHRLSERSDSFLKRRFDDTGRDEHVTTTRNQGPYSTNDSGPTMARTDVCKTDKTIGGQTFS
jgi:hypothetical protein